ncbi:MAG: shikimate dehydrogenase [Proteobacteria bacterium]|nr:shikimate dehydrogenase [Pseudomonadota bacterium]
MNGQTKLFFVVGHPVGQVKAPVAFNAVFRQAGINALVVPLDLAPQDVLSTCRALLASPTTGGILVTVPYKKTLFELADVHGDDALAVGAVNALRRASDGQILGDLFDGAGFLGGLMAAGHDPHGRRVLVLGAGGAGSAIAAALARTSAAWIGLYDPTAGRADELTQQLRAQFPGGPEIEALDSPLAPCDCVVNATPLGMRAADPLPIDPARLAPETLVVDVIMEPALTPLLRQAAERGLATHPGRPMLDHQLPAYLEFFQLPHAAQLAHASLISRAADPVLS